jgi:hypothetical protein
MSDLVDESSLEARLAALDLDQKVRLLTGADIWALHDEPAIGLRRIVTSDGPAGVRGERWDERFPSANVPSPTALAASWDPDSAVERLVRRRLDDGGGHVPPGDRPLVGRPAAHGGRPGELTDHPGVGGGGVAAW